MTLVQELPKAQFVNTNSLVNWQRAVKSAAEIEFIRKAAKITDKIITTAIECAEPGLRKNLLVADIVKAGVEGV
jgi:ectoine hydrolase